VRGQAIAGAEKALALDETLPEAHNARAVIALDGEWDLAGAQRHFLRALELRPSYAAAHNLYGQLLSWQLPGRGDEARQHFERARELDPFSPWNELNLLMWWDMQGQPERSIEEGDRARQRNPTLWVIPFQNGFAHLRLKRFREAARDFETALELLGHRPAAVVTRLGLSYGLAGRREDALAIQAELEQASRTRYVSPLFRAVVYSGLGQTDEAFRLLERALEERTPALLGLLNDATAVALCTDPRWPDLEGRIRSAARWPEGAVPIAPTSPSPSR